MYFCCLAIDDLSSLMTDDPQQRTLTENVKVLASQISFSRHDARLIDFVSLSVSRSCAHACVFDA